MKLQGRKKKADKENPIEVKDKNMIEPPKNLLTEKSEPDKVSVVDQEITPAAETEVKTTGQQAEAMPSVEAGVSAQPVVQADSTPPPISVPVTRFSPSYSSDKPANESFLKIVGLILVILFTVAGGWFYLSNKSQKEKVKTLPAITTEPKTEKVNPTVVATTEAKLDKYPIEILNGSGIPGVASTLQEILEKEGFKVSETGNADNYDYTDTVIQAKANIEKTFLEKLKILVAKSYSVGKNEKLSASDSSEVIVIVGSKKAEK